MLVDEFKEKLVDALKPGLVKSIQLRLKGVSEQDVIEAGKALKPICHRFNSTFIICNNLYTLNHSSLVLGLSAKNLEPLKLNTSASPLYTGVINFFSLRYFLRI